MKSPSAPIYVVVTATLFNIMLLDDDKMTFLENYGFVICVFMYVQKMSPRVKISTCTS